MYNTPPSKVMTRSQKKLHEVENSSEPNPNPVNPPDHRPQASNPTGNQAVKPETLLKAKSFTCATAKSAARSKISTSSTIARRKQLELEAAQAKAAIQMQLIDKQLEVNLANLEAEDAESVTERSQSLNGEAALNKVEVWLENSQAKPCAATEPPARNPPPLGTTEQQQPSSDIKQLAITLRDMMNQTQNQLLSRLSAPRDLPTFNGDYVEWLHYKSAYIESTNICKFSDTENLWRLRRSLRGEAREAVTDLLIGNTPPSSIMQTLELRYGRADIIIAKITSQLKRLPPLPQHYQSALIDFSSKVSNYVATIRALEKTDYLQSPELVNSVITKLPSTLLGRWTDYAYTRYHLNDMPKLEMLSGFLKHESEIILAVGAIVPHDMSTNATNKRTFDYSKQQSEKTIRERHNVFTTTAHDDEQCKFCKKAVHLLPDCRMFRRALRKDRWRFVKSQRLCFGCLQPRHESNECSVPACDIDNCGLSHNRLLHYNKPVQQTVAAIDVFTPPPRAHLAPPPPPCQQEQTSSMVDTVAHVSTSDYEHSPTVSGQVMLKVVQVKLSGPTGSELITYALLDDGASVSIIDSDLAKQLGLVSKESCAVKFVDAFGIEVLQSDTPKVTLDISSMDSNNCKYKIQLRKVSKLNLPTQNMSSIKNLQCKHLMHLKDHVCNGYVKPRLIIGEDNYHLLAPLQIIHGSKNEPYATKCRLGWCIHGHSGHTRTYVDHNIFHLTCSEPTDNDVLELNNLIKDSFAIDSIGISALRRENTAHIRALNILDSSIRKVNNQWEVGLPFKSDTFVMPDSYDNASSRMRSLSRKFNKDKEYAVRYSKEMDKLFTEGYAKEVTDGEKSPEHTWYLPHFGVQNPNKPGKLRLVFDAAAKVVQRKDGRHHRLTHVSAAALRHKYAILEHELRLQKSLSEECEDLGVDSPSASELFPEAELLFAPSPVHEQTIGPCHTPQPTILNQGIPQPDLEDQIATDHLLTARERQTDLDINLDDVGEIVTVGEDGMATIPLDHEEFARSHPNTTFHTEPEDGEIPPFTIAQSVKGRQITFHASRGPSTVVMAPQTTVISQAMVEASGTQNTVKFTDIDNMINSIPSTQPQMPSVLVKDDGLTRFDNILTDSRELHLSNTASAIVHSTGQGTQVIRRVRYDENRRESRYLIDDPMEEKIDDNRDLESMAGDDNSSPERHPELFWESNSASERSEGRRRLDFSSDSDKCCKSPFDDSTDSSFGNHTRLDSVIKAARTERSGSDGSSDDHPPLRTYPAKRSHHHPTHHDVEQSLSGKTRAGERCMDVEGRRRASNRGVVKRGCHCCNGSPAPPKPKKSRQKKTSADFTNSNNT